MVKKLLSFDAFSKTVEDARIRTASGGFVTIVSVVIILWLSLFEWLDYRKIEFRPELIVDKARGEKMMINFNFTFPHMPCDLLNLDILDVSGEVQEAITTGIRKTRLDQQGKDISSHEVVYETTEEGNTKARSESERAKKIRQLYESKGPNYCGSCWGSAPEGVERCCNTCEDVRRSYSEVGWAFHDGSGIEQCEQEGYQQWINETKSEGCNMAGMVKVNKVAGNFHFAPGSSFTFNGRHSHDLSLYGRKDMEYNFHHIVNHLSFGPRGDGLLSGGRRELMPNPLDGVEKSTDNKQFTFQYFVKVVATRYEMLNGKEVETNQYSVTSHERDTAGGRDEDHPHTLHNRGGVPGVYFSYEISPMKIINREQRVKTFGTFLTSICSIVGGVLTVGAIVDRGVWEADKALKRKKDL